MNGCIGMKRDGFISVWVLIIMSSFLLLAVGMVRLVTIHKQIVQDELHMVRTDYHAQRGLQWLSVYFQTGHTMNRDFQPVVLEDTPSTSVTVRLEQRDTTYIVGEGVDKEHHTMRKHGYRGTTYTNGKVLPNKDIF